MNAEWVAQTAAEKAAEKADERAEMTADAWAAMRGRERVGLRAVRTVDEKAVRLAVISGEVRGNHVSWGGREVRGEGSEMEGWWRGGRRKV